MPQKYKPVKDKRFFTPDTRYNEVDWNDESTAIKKFKEQLEGWYIEPIESLIADSRHYGFTVIALTCVLIDTLSQYRFGKETSSQTAFKDFLKDCFPSFGDKFSTPILVDNSNPKKPQHVENFADAVYRAFRCGILHEAHVSLYGVVTDDADTIEYLKNEDITRYADGKDCPTVVINPKKFFREIQTVFEDYFQKLLDHDPKWNDRRTNFKRKFLVSYGIDIGHEA